MFKTNLEIIINRFLKKYFSGIFSSFCSSRDVHILEVVERKKSVFRTKVYFVAVVVVKCSRYQSSIIKRKNQANRELVKIGQQKLN